MSSEDDYRYRIALLDHLKELIEAVKEVTEAIKAHDSQTAQGLIYVSETLQGITDALPFAGKGV